VDYYFLQDLFHISKLLGHIIYERKLVFVKGG